MHCSFRPRTRLNQEERRNQFNPFYDFWSEFDESDEIEEPRESREPRARAPRQPRARAPQSQAFEGIPRELIDNFFGPSHSFGSFFDQVFEQEAEQSPPRAERGSRPGRRRNDQFGVFNMFDFPDIFNDNQFENFGGVFHENFNPGNFMNNFHANFRSSGGFEDLLEHLMRDHQPATHPASRDVVDKLPIIKVEQKHCKKIEGKEEVEPPS